MIDNVTVLMNWSQSPVFLVSIILSHSIITDPLYKFVFLVIIMFTGISMIIMNLLTILLSIINEIIERSNIKMESTLSPDQFESRLINLNKNINHEIKDKTSTNNITGIINTLPDENLCNHY